MFFYGKRISVIICISKPTDPCVLQTMFSTLAANRRRFSIPAVLRLFRRRHITTGTEQFCGETATARVPNTGKGQQQDETKKCLFQSILKLVYFSCINYNITTTIMLSLQLKLYMCIATMEHLYVINLKKA